MNGPNVSCFELSLKNDTLSNEILKAFDNVEELFEKCFEKKQNYKMEGNGRIRIRYKIELESDKMGKEILLHLLPVEMTEVDMYKEMYKRIKEENEKMEEEKEKMGKKYENVLKNNKWGDGSIIPFHNVHSSHFAVDGNNVIYAGTDDQWRMLVFNTVLVDMQHYDCTASYIGDSNTQTWIGIVSEQHLQAVHVVDTSINSLCYWPTGKTISKNFKKVVDVQLDIQNCVNMVVRVQVDVRGGTAVFTITNSAEAV